MSPHKKRILFSVIVVIVTIGVGLALAFTVSSKPDTTSHPTSTLSPFPTTPSSMRDALSDIFFSPLSEVHLEPRDNPQILANGNPGGFSYWNPKTQIDVDGHGCVFVAYRQFSSNSTPGVSLAVRSPLATKWTLYPVDHMLFQQSPSLPEHRHKEIDH